MGFSRIGDVFGGWPRRLLALTCLLLAGLSALHAREPAAGASEPSVAVLVAARSLPAAKVIAVGDVRVATWPARLQPGDALHAPRDAIGQRLAGPISAGDAVTGERLVSAGLARGLPAGTVAIPVTLAGGGATTLIRAGDYVDLISTGGPDASGSSGTAAPAQIVAEHVLVLAVVPASPDSTTDSAQLVVAVARAAELTVAQNESTPLLATVSDHP